MFEVVQRAGIHNEEPLVIDECDSYSQAKDVVYNQKHRKDVLVIEREERSYECLHVFYYNESADESMIDCNCNEYIHCSYDYLLQNRYI